MAEEQKTDAKKEVSTLTLRNRWRVAHYGMKVSTYLAPCIPASIVTGVHWDEWFKASGGGGWSLPFGFATLLIAILLSIALILKKDEEIMKKVSPIIYATIIVTLLGISFMFLANIGNVIGQMFMYTAAGLIASLGADQFDKLKAYPKYKEYQKLVTDFGLDKKAAAKLARRKKAREEALAKAEKEREKEKEQPETVE